MFKKPKRPVYYGDRTSTTNTNGVTTGNAMDMHCGNATLRYNADRHGWAIPGSTGKNAKVFGLNAAVDFIQELAGMLD